MIDLFLFFMVSSCSWDVVYMKLPNLLEAKKRSGHEVLTKNK